MRLGFQFLRFNWPGGSARLGADVGEIARGAEEAGFDSVWTMDHFFQLEMVAPVDEPILEAYATLGYLAAQTRRVKLGALVTGPMYRYPGVLIKQVTTLDVLSGGRAMLGLGASWWEREHRGLGVPFPPLAERFERLEETLQIAHRMWGGDTSPYVGKHYRLEEPLNSPPSLSRPRPPILIGGGGERKTLRLVAQYADACNFAGRELMDVPRKLDVLREHCATVGRDFDEIERTALLSIIDVGVRGERAQELVEQLGLLAEAGIQTVIGSLAGTDQRRAIEIFARDVIPQANKL